MLLQFAVENFLSFHGETVLSMVAPPGATVGAVDVPGQPGMRVMRVAALYGANASGKSNLVEAMRAAEGLIAKGVEANAKLPARPFKLDADAMSAPSRFQFDFVIAEQRYSYTIEFTAESVRAEALYRVPAGTEERLVFERETPDGGGDHAVTLGDALLEGDDEQRQFVRFVARGTRVNQPLLTEFAQRNVAGLTHVWRWFEEGVQTVKPTQNFENLITALHKRPELLTFCAESLARSGTGVTKLEVRSRPPEGSFENAIMAMNRPRPERDSEAERSILREINHTFDGSGTTFDSEAGRVRELVLLHGAPDHAVEFELTEESDGTQRMLHLLPVLFDAQRFDRAVVVDELDRSLHTAITRRFVEDFNAAADLGGARSQLIFTTHDTNLLNGRLIAPASIWFVEKDPRGATRLHSLAEYREEQLTTLLDHLEDGYLQGRFGAIPFLAPREALHWTQNGMSKAS
jgi:uncharacterized protein